MAGVDNVLTRTEKVVAKIWARDLGVPEISAKSDFFELGGDSLRMLDMLFHVHRILGAELSPGVLFQNSSLRAFSLAVELVLDKEKSSGQSPVREGVVEGRL
jgi:acyl carrier protein